MVGARPTLPLEQDSSHLPTVAIYNNGEKAGRSAQPLYHSRGAGGWAAGQPCHEDVLLLQQENGVQKRAPADHAPCLPYGWHWEGRCVQGHRMQNGINTGCLMSAAPRFR